ncbi:hypothetical protein N7462_005577 [Penicillium macrosclerotiorum]|uniref:uncharacterized protein n=1 Tax=Penicillium macrosclerotiorum TaxID=303699 RepID=UPI002547AAF4|nr:uncharacterized protein N7462_005577 [Penicillium macrosclerotiorum]KAJ5682412.1 hypothetical protein N7462_005577 [Penicillium macrosclerotiorum]
MSGELVIKEHLGDGTDVFALPPAALSPAKVDSASRRSSRSDPTYVPASPTSPELTARGRNAQASRSGTVAKRPLEDFDLPPPPTRTRKIIQMKPKAPASKSPTKTKDNARLAQSSPDATANPGTTNKKKTPSATSAAGRKIARKTAHSLIERRRRSKMNEEFGTLKDMIPACRGQEMHKLAILQASIDYVNYLERCIQDLKTAGTTHSTAAPPSPTSPEFIAEGGTSCVSQSQPPQRPPSSIYSYSASASPELLPPDGQISDVSPSFSPRTRMPSVHTLSDVPSILPSPALGPSHSHPSLEKIQDLQGSDHEASAALLMLTRDRRGTADSISEHFAGSTTLYTPTEDSRTGRTSSDAQRRNGMSVRDLLIS